MPQNENLLSLLSIKIGGADVSPDFMSDLLEVTIENSLHLPDVAAIVLHDTRLHWIDDNSLLPGQSVQIEAHSGRQSKLLFDGEIVEIEPSFDASNQQLIIRAFDRLHRLGRGSRVRSFVNVSDEDLIRKLAAEAGLQAQVGVGGQVHDYILQSNESNLEFLQRRAAALGCLLYVQGKTLHVEPLKNGGGQLELEWGVNLHEFAPRLTTLGQFSKVTVRGWDPAQRRAVVSQAQNGRGAPQIGQEQSGGELVQQAFQLTAEALVAAGSVRTQAEADRLAQAVADRAAGRFIEAEGACAGLPALVAGISVRIKAVGTRFSGTYFVTSTLHSYSARHGYLTRFSVSGYQPATVLNLLGGADPRQALPTATLAGPLSTGMGLVIGIVTDNDDPAGWGRVKVKYPSLSEEHASGWARVVVPGGGAQRGIQFLPEVNDEVLVGFLEGDIQHPYILGGLWNGQDRPPEPQAASGGRVQKRLLRSRTGHLITLDDSEGGGGITISDSAGNSIKIDTASNSLQISVQGNISLKARGSLSLEAQGQVQLKGQGVNIDGGAGVVTVKGTTINLN
ncbi:MAG: VgrG-related protein [Thermogemmatispora sp.]|uniref:VgrG-related protein n=1 Tax=Thermogemmatispora sp. TaxID=1968838 RepID=UPI0019DC40B2|nr:VgrG-related protein [Thermogemmatispora sp.]MBE3565034.1 VgrG-related protein [Thermogemmatispora sp.]